LQRTTENKQHYLVLVSLPTIVQTRSFSKPIMASSLFSLEGQTALITGATRGIGQAVAVGLAEAGADVILVQVRQLSRCAPQPRLTH
jgi:shikimate 5-dehydrogenase